MKKHLRPTSILLAGLLHLSPLVARIAHSCPGLAASPIAIVMTWIIRAAAVAGTCHAVSAASAQLASATTVNGKQGTPLSYQIRINDGSNRTSESWTIGGKLFAASGSTTNGMPPGLKLNLTTGIINGTPTQAGDFPTTITAWEHPGGTGASLTFTVHFIIASTAVPTTIATQPLGVNLHVGEALNLTVVAAGTAPFTYAWQKDGTNIVGATATNYTVTAVDLQAAGTYTVEVKGAGPGTNSAPAVVTVTPLRIGFQSHTASTATLSLQTAAGRQYVIEATPTLVPSAWEQTGQIDADGGGAASFTDNSATNATRFWRYRPLP
jgi:hypothetical protein